MKDKSKWFFSLFTLVNIFFFSWLAADCMQTADFSVGWRRDNIKWNMKGLHSSYVSGRADSRIFFRKAESYYTLNGKAKWLDTFYYVRLSGEYGTTNKGRARERFRIDSPLLYYPIDVHTSDPIKRGSELYDFNIAAGYPFCFCCSRLSVVPLVGFSFHRQRLRVKHDRDESSYCCYSSSSSRRRSSSSSCRCRSSSSYSSFPSSFLSSLSSYSSSWSDRYCRSCHSSSHFSLSSSNPFAYSPSSDPFSSRSDPNIASALGLSNPHRTDNHRFTWYGFYLGTDLAYALDPCWTLFSELEVHFLNYTHRKRESWTGVYFVDDYHKKDYSYGFNTVYGLTYTFCSCWYSIISIDYRWWKSSSSRDDIRWQMVGVKAGLGYIF